MTFKHKLSKRLALMRDEALAVPLAFHPIRPIRSKQHGQPLDTVAFIYSQRPSYWGVARRSTPAATLAYATAACWHKGCLWVVAEAKASGLSATTNED
jgi:hypothetical protein